MLQRLGQFGVMIVATLFIWFSVAMVDVVSQTEWMTDIAVGLAFLSTIAIWIVQGLSGLESHGQPVQEKAKRQPDESSDARLALLLQLLDDDERAALKRRLVNELSADGEAVPLADLLAAQDHADSGSGYRKNRT